MLDPTTPAQRVAQRELFATLDVETLKALHAIALGNKDWMQSARIRIAVLDQGFEFLYRQLGLESSKARREVSRARGES